MIVPSMSSAIRSGPAPVTSARSRRVQHVETPEIRLQRLRDAYGSVGLLVVLQERDDPARRGQGAVQRGHARVARLRDVRSALADVEPSRLIGGAVGRR